MATTAPAKTKLRKKLHKYLNTFIEKNTFSLRELQMLEKNVQPLIPKQFAK